MQAPGIWWHFKSYCVPLLSTRLLEMWLNSLIHMYSVTLDWQWKESTYDIEYALQMTKIANVYLLAILLSPLSLFLVQFELGYILF